MTRCLFISDLHLDQSRPGVTAALGRFLEQNRDCQALYVLGDLFEAWVGDDDDSQLAAEVRAMFERFAGFGPRLYFMRGNRDFLLGEAFCSAAGGQLLPDPTVITLDGNPTLLMHGDSLCTADRDYQRFRQMARDPQWQADILGRSLAERRSLARELREISRDATSNKAEDILDVTPAEVERVMAEHGVDRLIHGHTHRPARHDQRHGTRWVLGDWDRTGWQLTAENGELELMEFPL